MRIMPTLLAGCVAFISANASGADGRSAHAPTAPSSLANPVASDTPPLPNQLEAVFISACFDGAVKLGADQETPITLADLPSSLRRRFGKPLSGSVWRLNSSTPTYLYTMNFAPDRTTSPKVCGIATQSIPLKPAIEFLGTRMNGPSLTPLHTVITGAEWLDAEHGYVAAATKIDEFTVLEVKQLTKEQQRGALKAIPSLKIYPFPG